MQKAPPLFVLMTATFQLISFLYVVLLVVQGRAAAA